MVERGGRCTPKGGGPSALVSQETHGVNYGHLHGPPLRSGAVVTRLSTTQAPMPTMTGLRVGLRLSPRSESGGRRSKGDNFSRTDTPSEA